jgi:hypothetical protein
MVSFSIDTGGVKMAANRDRNPPTAPQLALSDFEPTKAQLWETSSSAVWTVPASSYRTAVPKAAGVIAWAAFAASLAGATGGLTVPGVSVPEYFPTHESAFVRPWAPNEPQLPAWEAHLRFSMREVSWAEAAAIAAEELVRMEAKRIALAERETALYDADEFDDEELQT